MIRLATPDDQTALLAVAEATGLFTPEELAGFGGMIGEHLASGDASGNAGGDASGDAGGGDNIWLVDEAEDIVAAAYYAPEQFAGEGVWNLYFIGVRPSEQGKGRGSALIHYVEKDLKARGARLLLVETSGKDSFEPTRTFYCKNGYSEEARIRDYYTAGDDKIVFRKLL